MRSFRELFAQRSASAIFTAANEHGGEKECEEYKGEMKKQRGKKKERKREQKKIKNRMEIRLGRYEDNKSRRPSPRSLLSNRPQTRGLKRYRIRENRVHRKSVRRERPLLFDPLCGKTAIITPVHPLPAALSSLGG